MTQSTLENVLSTGQDPAYTGLMGDLRKAKSRVEAARITAELSSVADDIAAALRDPGLIDEDDEDTGRDPIAWTDITTHLIRISLALSGGTYDTADQDDQDNAADWLLLSEADNRAEFAKVWAPIAVALTAKTVPAEGEDKPQLRVFTVTQTLAVAQAVIDANW